MSLNHDYTTEQGQAALDEFGFEIVPLDCPGAPTPGRVADRLHDILVPLIGSLDRGDWLVAGDCLQALRRLRLALDSWDVGMLARRLKGDN